MKLHFEPDLPFQKDAIDAVVDLFAGEAQEKEDHGVFTVPAPTLPDAPLLPEEETHGRTNRLALSAEELTANLHTVQLRNGIKQSPAFSAKAAAGGPDFTVEMETGTGKTYVYLRTMLELHRRCGWSKFVVVVPSVAIRQGVLKSLEITREHFRGLFAGEQLVVTEYDGSRPQQVRSFATALAPQVMVMTVQAINKMGGDRRMGRTEDRRKGNNFYKPHEALGGAKPVDVIAGCRPVVVVDEPQSVDGGLKGQGRKALQQLGAVATLRYSATHADEHHPVFSLDAVEAYKRKLVKRIEVAGATVEASSNEAFLRFEGVTNAATPKAKLTLDVADAQGNPVRKKKTVSAGSDLEAETGLPTYRGWWIEDAVGGDDPRLELDVPGDRKVLRPGDALGDAPGTQMEALLIERTIRAHLDKELERQDQGIKVLSLFFVDRVEDYRVYDTHGNASPGRLARLFEERYAELSNQQKYRELFLVPPPLGGESSSRENSSPPKGGGTGVGVSPGEVHDGYFAKDKKTGRLKDTADNDRSANSAEAISAYELIMNAKERLLSFKEPRKFIFSHSALREGWDNPNVFQICSLREMNSERQRRQTLGRGLRLCVDADGKRVRDDRVNVLTVVAAEGYKAYAAALQQEYREAGVVFGRVPAHAFARLVAEENGPPVGEGKSRELFSHLVEEKLLKANGDVTDTLKRILREGELELPEAFAELAAGVEAILRERVGREIEVTDANEKKKVEPQKALIDSAAFRALWSRIHGRTAYRVEFDTEALVAACLKELKVLSIQRARVRLETAGIGLSRAGVEASSVKESAPAYLSQERVRLPDALAELEARTGLTRRTIARLLRESGKLGLFLENPRVFLGAFTRIVNEQKRGLMVSGIRYERDGRWWDASLLQENEERALSKLVEGGPTSTLTWVPCDSEVEARFVEDLRRDESVKAFAKLPRKFRVHTPLGPYEPDWAVVADVDGDGTDRLYLVVETKGTDGLFEGLRGREQAKIDCARKHFEVLAGDGEKPADYRVAQTWEAARAMVT